MSELSLSNVEPAVKAVLEATGFKLENLDKVSRTIYGMTTSKGFVGGVGEDAPLDVILAKYDELGGYITKNGYKVKNRAFFDPKTKRPVKNPKIVFIIKMNGQFVEHPEGAPESIEIQVAKKQFEEDQKKKEKHSSQTESEKVDTLN